VEEVCILSADDYSTRPFILWYRLYAIGEGISRYRGEEAFIDTYFLEVFRPVLDTGRLYDSVSCIIFILSCEGLILWRGPLVNRRKEKPRERRGYKYLREGLGNIPSIPLFLI